MLGAAAARLGAGGPAEPLRGLGEQLLGRLAGDRVRVELGRRRAMVPEPRAAHQRLDVAGRDVHERDVGFGRDGVDAVLPPALDDPHDRAHQTTCRANHRLAVAASRIAGTVLSPSTVNARMSVGSSCACITRRHSSVASEPT